MKKTILTTVGALFLVVFLSATTSVYAGTFDNNNIFGANVASPTEADLSAVASMVNTNGAEWGYVTFVIQENQRNPDEWNNLFRTLREKKLIPIVRIATKAEGNNWKRPSQEDASAWVEFLDSLQWPIQNRYVVLFNEPNHGREWGGSVQPEDYGRVARSFAIQLNQRDPDFFVMLAGFDSNAPSQNPAYEDQVTFLNRMMKTFPVADLNKYIDGWASHSYPNPGFRGKPTDTGRNSIQNYAWELSFLQSKGIKALPVFITETGWPRSSYSEETISQYLKHAFTQVWFRDFRVKAVTPFVFNYENSAFRDWSWRKAGSNQFYSYYDMVKSLPKIRGTPVLANGRQQHKQFVYRFWSDSMDGHFFTTSWDERNMVIATYDTKTWRYEGIAYETVSKHKRGAVPLHRFWSDARQTHFYTADPNEKRQMEQKSEWRYEGIAYYVMPSNGSGNNVYRFWSPRFKKHFYTISSQERDQIKQQMSDSWQYEGVSWRIP